MARVQFEVIGSVCGRNGSQLTCGAALHLPTTPALLSANDGDSRVHRGQTEEQEDLRDGGVSTHDHQSRRTKIKLTIIGTNQNVTRM